MGSNYLTNPMRKEMVQMEDHIRERKWPTHRIMVYTNTGQYSHTHRQHATRNEARKQEEHSKTNPGALRYKENGIQVLATLLFVATCATNCYVPSLTKC